MPENQSEKKGKLIPVIRGKNSEASPAALTFGNAGLYCLYWFRLERTLFLKGLTES